MSFFEGGTVGNFYIYEENCTKYLQRVLSKVRMYKENKIKYLHEKFKPRQEFRLKLLFYSVLQKLELLMENSLLGVEGGALILKDPLISDYPDSPGG
jgi:hypothetical protein